MPIYEYACPACRVIFSFLSKRVNPTRKPVCPRCGNRKMTKEISHFAALSGGRASSDSAGEGPMPDVDDPRIAGAMEQLEREMDGMDENNPRHMGHLLRKMKELMPPGSTPAELESAIRRLEAGEDPEKIEEDMGDVLDSFLGDDISEEGKGSGGAPYRHDPGLYDL